MPPGQDYYLLINNVPHGPYTAEQIQDWIKSQSIQVDLNSVSFAIAGSSNWQPISSFSVAPVLPVAPSPSVPDKTVSKLSNIRIRPNLKLAALVFISLVVISAGLVLVSGGKLLMNEAGRSLLLVPGGSFQMGSDEYAAEKPVRQVSVAAFFMGETEVTFGEWVSVLGWAKVNGYAFSNEGSGTSDKHPVTDVSWYDTVKWCNAKSEKEGLTPCYRGNGGIYRRGTEDGVTCDWGTNGYRLPTEAEWEKAARGGLVGKKFPNGDSLEKTDANINGLGTVEVGKYPANGYGLRDMAGNVWEWCWDWYGTPYAGGIDPRGAGTGSYRVLRGGDWFNYANLARSASRNSGSPSNASNSGGFRLARGRL